MSSGKTASKKRVKNSASRPKRNPSGVTLVWGSESSTIPAGRNNNGAGKSVSGRKRNPATPAPESEEILKANELLSRVWENTYSKRDRFGKFDRE
jgi:hypothetical protein